MEDSILEFQSVFPSVLREASEKILKTEIKVGRRFQSADSFSYLLNTNSGKYVGKIYRFAHWPPQGKLQYIETLLDKNHIPHEETIYSSHEHPLFRFGWQISKYIPGGAARDLRETGKFNPQEYYIKTGKILRRIHEIQFDYYGSLHDKEDQFSSFQEYTMHELEEQDYSNLPNEYAWAHKIIDEAKTYVHDVLPKLEWGKPVLVHDDVNDRNVIWNQGDPIIIDWVDSLASTPSRDFATMTFRQDDSVIPFIERGYGEKINEKELKVHQIMRFIRLGRFFYFEDKDVPELKKMMDRLSALLKRSRPYGS